MGEVLGAGVDDMDLLSVGVCVLVDVEVAVLVEEVVVEGVMLSLMETEALADDEAVGDVVFEGLTVVLEVTLWLGDTDSDGVSEAETVALTLSEGEIERDNDRDTDSEMVSVTDKLSETLSDGLSDCEAL